MSYGLELASQLRGAVEEGRRLFEGAPEPRTAAKPAAGWSAREVIGHLIDSACNNYRRFIINQDAPVLQVDPYEQNAWVARGCYAGTTAAELVTLWSAYNQHIARVLEAIPDEVLNRARGDLRNYSLGYIPPPQTAHVTLGLLAADYVAHIHHHLKQIRPLLHA